MNANTKLWLTHAGCIVIVALCAAISTIPQVHSIPMAGEALVGVAGWAWGKLGFKPSQAWLEKFLQGLTPAEVAKLTTPPPPPLLPPPTQSPPQA